MPTTTIVIIAAVIIVGLLVLLLRRKPELPEPKDEAPPLARPRPETARKPKPAPAAAPERPIEREKPPAPPPQEEEEEGREHEREPEPDREQAEEPPAPAAEAAAPAEPAPPVARRAKDIRGLRKGLAKVRESGGLFGRLKALFVGKKQIDPALVDEIEEVLLTSDVGVKTTARLIARLRESLAKDALGDADRVWDALRAEATALLDLPGGGAIRDHGQPTVILMVGVNGTGKTTTIGKLATKLREQEHKVLLVAADTFRAAAVAQLTAWGKRVGCEVFAGKDGADPASVVFDAVSRGVEDAFDFILVDTAGRLHTKSNLMDELRKVHRTAGKALDGAPHEVLLVVDGTTGQNAIQQTQEFQEALPLSGIVLTKLDGTAKGGVVLAIAAEHGVPVRYVGVGERPPDLRDFDAEEFVEAMLGHGDDAAEAA